MILDSDLGFVFDIHSLEYDIPGGFCGYNLLVNPSFGLISGEVYDSDDWILMTGLSSIVLLVRTDC